MQRHSLGVIQLVTCEYLALIKASCLRIILFDEGDTVTDQASTALGLELRDDLVATSGFPELTVFVNYAHGDEKIEQIYGREKLPRLAALKNIWDPHKVFSWNNGLPTKYP